MKMSSPLLLLACFHLVAYLVGCRMVTTVRPWATKAERRLRRHPLPVDDQLRQSPGRRCLFVALQEGGSPFGQMEITPMGGGEERMAFAIMQEQQRSAAQDLARAPDQAAGDQTIG